MNFLDARLPDRFWSKVIPEPNSGCWLWLGGLQHNDYGAYTISGKNIRAHRFAYSVLVGEIRDGMVLDHLCRTPPCCNPAHLEQVTQRENVLRGVGPSSVGAAATHCPSGHPYDDANTRLQDGTRQCRQCNREWVQARRATLVASGLCVAGASHGPARPGRKKCVACTAKQDARNAEWRLKRAQVSK